MVPGARVESRATATLDFWPVAVPFESPFERTAGSELERRIEAALAALPVEAREVLLLVGIEGLTPSEAAAVCGVTPEAMRQRLKRARAELSRRLDDPEPTVVDALPGGGIMIANEKPDDLLRALASLPSPTPAAARDARIRARCHAALTRRKPRSWQARSSWRRFRPSWPRVFTTRLSALVDACWRPLSVVYGIVVVAEALRLAGLF